MTASNDVSTLTGRDAETQELRMNAVKGKNLLYLASNSTAGSSPTYMVEMMADLRKRGLVIYGVFETPTEKKPTCPYLDQLKSNDAVDHVFFAELNCEEAASNVVEAIKHLDVKFDGVWGGRELIQPVVGMVAELLGAPGRNPAHSYQMARDKYKTRVALANAGLNTPMAYPVKSVDDVPKCIETVGFPMIIKPTAGAGSEGVHKVYTEEELTKAVGTILEDIEVNPLLSTQGMTDFCPIVAETLLVPIIYNDLVQEFDVEVLMSKGESVYSNVVDNWIPDAPYFQDKGFNFPSLAPKSVQEELIEYSIACVKALGFINGNFHVESMYTEYGPALLEVNPRVGGAEIQNFHERVFGVNPNLNFLLALLDIPINPPRFDVPAMGRLHHFINAPTTGVLEDLTFLDHFEGHEYVTKIEYIAKVGASVRGIDTGVPQWLGGVVFEFPEEKMLSAIEELKVLMKQAEDNVRKLITPIRKFSLTRRKSIVLDVVEDLEPAQKRRVRKSITIDDIDLEEILALEASIATTTI
ncbi:hypothetical protein SARC_01764 [Sphaeroforma arctica JP610]|uniref:ATP-grasp domain-containing protein n=1 Tax=Sphaeroforma arctica JP610 TaxID=667725 RepID=A0A0L0GAP3_9EUKA|nr:hypothetical protein SARC_01764 [Sphaeroforma arctica JP610]KNC86072.1 hypothetical protein SARC_01764 [Sphaeroforma arctica JP610]|eukprot:XP_014159974.1 hypothetical protein SARC_01764 [Sphaeroforma arctica JP610]